MNYAETLVYVAANSPPISPVRAGCTTLVMSEDRELRPHREREVVADCGRAERRCGKRAAPCAGGRSSCKA
ncbi:MAG TPA: hypothetical protein VHC22_15410 [Pirellulales bacterium]|nr:hypothetical protein [Pirellulales bacterium]